MPMMQYERGGLILSQHMGNALMNKLDGVTWAADNGCFSASEQFTETKWLHFLERYAGKGICQFAVLPDIPYNMEATLERSMRYADRVHELGYRVALAIQNGARPAQIPWDSIDAIFIAGDAQFKTSLLAWYACREAKRRGKYVHIARRNSKRALQISHDMGADSCDGTFIRFAPAINFQRLQKWFEDFCPHNPTDLRIWGDDAHYSRCMHCGRDVWKVPTFGGRLRRRAA